MMSEKPWKTVNESLIAVPIMQNKFHAALRGNRSACANPLWLGRMIHKL